jgi:hypothetical protein
MNPGNGTQRPTDDPSERTTHALKHTLELAWQKQKAEDQNDGKNEGHTSGIGRHA